MSNADGQLPSFHDPLRRKPVSLPRSLTSVDVSLPDL
jgi:hypothetical protein